MLTPVLFVLFVGAEVAVGVADRYPRQSHRQRLENKTKTDRQADRQTRQTDTTDRQTDRQTETDRQKQADRNRQIDRRQYKLTTESMT